MLLMRQSAKGAAAAAAADAAELGGRKGTAVGQLPNMVFEWPEWITVKGHRISYGGQEVGVAPYDAGDGKVSLVVATPGGRHVFWAADDIGTSQTVPPMQPPP